jgi:hypothetical protein
MKCKASDCGDPGLIPGRWDLLWTKWHEQQDFLRAHQFPTANIISHIHHTSPTLKSQQLTALLNNNLKHKCNTKLTSLADFARKSLVPPEVSVGAKRGTDADGVPYLL